MAPPARAGEIRPGRAAGGRETPLRRSSAAALGLLLWLVATLLVGTLVLSADVAPKPAGGAGVAVGGAAGRARDGSLRGWSSRSLLSSDEDDGDDEDDSTDYDYYHKFHNLDRPDYYDEDCVDDDDDNDYGCAPPDRRHVGGIPLWAFIIIILIAICVVALIVMTILTLTGHIPIIDQQSEGDFEPLVPPTSELTGTTPPPDSAPQSYGATAS